MSAEGHDQDAEDGSPSVRLVSPVSPLVVLPLPPFPLGGDHAQDGTGASLDASFTPMTTTETTEAGKDITRGDASGGSYLDLDEEALVENKENANGPSVASEPSLQGNDQPVPGDQHPTQAQDRTSPRSPHLPIPPFPLKAGLELTPVRPAGVGGLQVPMVMGNEEKGADGNGTQGLTGEAPNHDAAGVRGEDDQECAELAETNESRKTDKEESGSQTVDAPPAPARQYVSPLESHHFPPSIAPPGLDDGNANGSARAGTFVPSGDLNLSVSFPPAYTFDENQNAGTKTSTAASSDSALPSLGALPTPNFMLDAPRTDSPSGLRAPTLPFLDTGSPGLGFADPAHRRFSAVELSPTSTPADQLLAAHADLRRFSIFDSAAPAPGPAASQLPRPGALSATRRTHSAVDLTTSAGISIPPHLRPARGRPLTPSALGSSRSDSFATLGSSSSTDDQSSQSRSSSRAPPGDAVSPAAPAPRARTQSAVRYSTFAEMGISNVAVAGKGERTIDARKREQQLAARAERAKANRGNRLSKAFTRDSFPLILPGAGKGSAEGAPSDASDAGEVSRPGSRPSSSMGVDGGSSASLLTSLPPGAAAPALIHSDSFTAVPDRPSGKAPSPLASPPNGAAPGAKKLKKAKSRDCIIM